MLPQEFYGMLESPDSIINFLLENDIIPSRTRMCSACNIEMKIRFKKRKDKEFSFLFRCHKCKTDQACLRNTFFATNFNNCLRQKLSLAQILKISFAYNELKTYNEIMHISGVKQKKTIVDWTKYIRNVMTNEITNRPKMGGPRMNIQIDESLFRGRRKYNRGRMLAGDLDIETAADAVSRRKNYGDRIEGPWVFGLIQEGSTDVSLFFVERRDAQTLLPIIKANVAEGSTIVSDGWAAYHRISELGFFHKTVIHEENFVDPLTGANTQRIESEWSQAKYLIMRRRRGTTQLLLQSHLDEYCFRKRYQDNIF